MAELGQGNGGGAALRALLDALTTNAPPKDREIEAAKRRARAANRTPIRA